MKYLLDTNVISQYSKNPPDPVVDAWFQRTDDSAMYLCDVTFAELWYGVHLLAPGKKRLALEAWIEDDLYMQFFNQVLWLSFDVARTYGSLMARAEKNGFSPSTMDGLIAATAVANGMVMATLNRKDFEQLGVEIVEF